MVTPKNGVQPTDATCIALLVGGDNHDYWATADCSALVLYVTTVIDLIIVEDLVVEDVHGKIAFRRSAAASKCDRIHHRSDRVLGGRAGVYLSR